MIDRPQFGPQGVLLRVISKPTASVDLPICDTGVIADFGLAEIMCANLRIICGGFLPARKRNRAFGRTGALLPVPNILPGLKLRRPDAVSGEIAVSDNEQFVTN